MSLVAPIANLTKTLALKMHFLVGLGMFFVIALMVMENDITKRALLLIPIVLLYGLSRILFSMDQAETMKVMMENYKKTMADKPKVE